MIFFFDAQCNQQQTRLMYVCVWRLAVGRARNNVSADICIVVIKLCSVRRDCPSGEERVEKSKNIIVVCTQTLHVPDIRTLPGTRSKQAEIYNLTNRIQGEMGFEIEYINIIVRSRFVLRICFPSMTWRRALSSLIVIDPRWLFTYTARRET